MGKANKKKSVAADPQRHAFMLTINNPIALGYDHKKIHEIIIDNFPTIQYYCFSDEVGKRGNNPHTHLYLFFSSRVRWSKVQRYFRGAHIEQAFGTPMQNRDYILKSGKWEESDKASTRVEGSFYESGEVPKQDGRDRDMAMLYSMISDENLTTGEIIARNHDFIRYVTLIDKIRTELLYDKYRSTRRLNLHVIYVQGKTGKGKTMDVLNNHGDINVYRVTDYKHMFDSYTTQPVLVFEEFRSQIPIADMLLYLDIYSVTLPARYSNRVLCAETIYILSNWTLEEQYLSEQRSSPETWNAFLRRIHEVKVYNEDGTITVYDSVKDYLDRENKFHLSAESTPFDDNTANPDDNGNRNN